MVGSIIIIYHRLSQPVAQPLLLLHSLYAVSRYYIVIALLKTSADIYFAFFQKRLPFRYRQPILPYAEDFQGVVTDFALQNLQHHLRIAPQQTL